MFTFATRTLLQCHGQLANTIFPLVAWIYWIDLENRVAPVLLKLAIGCS